MDRLGRSGWALLVAAALALIGITTFLVVLAATGSDLIELNGIQTTPVDLVVAERDALPWTLAALVSALIVIGLWARDRARAARADDAEARYAAARDDLERAEGELGDAQRRATELEAERDETRERLDAVEQSRTRERDWTAKLQNELHALSAERGLFGGEDDVKSLVLRMTIALLDAEKGLLFSAGEGGDGRIVTAEGWDHDPGEGSLARRFASEVVDRDTIVRERAEDLGGEGEGGADDEIHNLIAIPIYIAEEFSGVVVCANSDDIDRHDDEVLLALGDHAGAVLDNSTLRDELRGAYVATVRMLAEAIRAKDPHLGGHSHEVSRYVGRVATRLGLDSARSEELIFASLLHDVGKIGISERILLKPGRLTAEEYTVVKLHPRIGCRLVQQVPALSPLGQYILHHHEWFDGSGYPTGLRGEEIPLEARVIGVADAFSAMTSDRPYQGRMSLEQACTELERNAGTQFDPKVVKIFTEEVRKEPPRDVENPAVAALDDPELRAGRADGSLLIGDGPLELTDHLTLLYTHRYFHEAVAAEAERAKLQDGGGFVVLLVELTGIDKINREHGYDAGDAAIKAAAHGLEEAAVHCGGSAARYGGRRLALLCPGAGVEDAEGIAERVRGLVAGEIELGATWAVWQAGETGEDVIRRAERGLRAVAAG